MRRTLTIITALVALTALAMPTAGVAAKNKTVKVRDDFFSPTKVKVKKDAKVKFNWGSSNINTHNVTLKKGPKGVKKSKPCTKRQDHQVQRVGERCDRDQVQPEVQQEGHLQLRLHDPPDDDEGQGRRQVVVARGS